MKPTSFFEAAVTLTVAILTVGTQAPAEVFLYHDDFETDAAMYDSWRHAAFVTAPPDIGLFGYLLYQPNGLTGGRGLGFYSGFEPGTDGFLGYAVLPQGAQATGGSISFLLLPNFLGINDIRVWGSDDGMSWSLLGAAQTPGEVSFPVVSSSRARYLELRGDGLVDNLSISVSYIPEPTGLSLLALGGLVVIGKGWKRGGA